MLLLSPPIATFPSRRLCNILCRCWAIGHPSYNNPNLAASGCRTLCRGNFERHYHWRHGYFNAKVHFCAR